MSNLLKLNRNRVITAVAFLLAVGATFGAQAQSVAEDFTGVATTNPWYFFNGACLTAGTAPGVVPVGNSPGQVPGCTAIGASYYNQPLVGGQNGVAGNSQTLPDPVGQGALRFTNGSPGGYRQNGGIVSTTPFATGQGISVTFKTVTYRGDSGGAGGDGADGISFYLMDSSQLNTAVITGTSSGDGNGLGAWGGSLGYTCSNANPPYNGLIGAYLGLGIDEYGNFLNGSQYTPPYTGPNPITGDNTASGYGYKPNRIGLRGAGNIASNWLNANFPLVYPTGTSPANQNAAVTETCRSGVLWDYVTNTAKLVNGATVPLPDYAPIPGAYAELPATTQIAAEAAMSRPAATPIFYALKITPDGLLSLSYSIAGAAYQPIINKQDITVANGALPANFLFGFAGSTGGSNNIHEILCFKADPSTTSNSGAGASEKQSTKLETGAQAYFAFYNPSNDWLGRVTASNLGFDAFGNVTIAATANWDASCNLTGVPATFTCPTTGAAGPLAPQVPATRTILSWNGARGIPFEWASLTSAPAGGQQAVIDAGDTAPLNANRVNFLRGDRSNEINTSGVGLFRRRSSVLGDIVDSSPVWVGRPNLSYTAVWQDRINVAAVLPENVVGSQTYAQYVTAQTSRQNVVYVGSNDGLVHGFRSGFFDASNTFQTATNDGQEVLAYMPGAIVQSIHSATQPNVDFAGSQYGHNFFVDATPGSGDLFYAGQWHTWLVGGLGTGGAAIYALDITNPTPGNFTEGNAASLVVGEWTPASIVCVNVAVCGKNLGNTWGIPLVRRLHDGKWAVIFGNGFGSVSGDAGIYVMTIDPVTAAQSIYYLSTATGSAASPNGIAYTAAADLDGDHITDYVYAGDLKGNIWRFDLTSSNEASWAVSQGPLFTAAGGQPITSQLVAAAGAPSPGMAPQVMILFGTGQKTPLTNAVPASFAPGAQALYGVWDWNLSAWNAKSAAQYASLAVGATGLGAPYTLTAANLQAQAVTVDPLTQNRDINAPAPICWAGPPACAGNKQFGWFFNLPGPQEQVIYSGELVAQAFTVNSVVPAVNLPTSCTNLLDTGFTYVLSALSGVAFNQVFLPPDEKANPLVANNPRYNDANAIGMQTNATGSSFVVLNNAGTPYLVFQTNQGSGPPMPPGLNLPPNTTGRRLSWIERR